MTKASYLLLALLAVALAACAVFAYLWIDRAISLSYLQQSFATENNAVRRLQSLLEREWKGQPEAQVLLKLKNAASSAPQPQPIVKQEEGAIWFDEIRFNIEQGRLVSVGEHAARR